MIRSKANRCEFSLISSFLVPTDPRVDQLSVVYIVPCARAHRFSWQISVQSPVPRHHFHDYLQHQLQPGFHVSTEHCHANIPGGRPPGKSIPPDVAHQCFCDPTLPRSRIDLSVAGGKPPSNSLDGEPAASQMTADFFVWFASFLVINVFSLFSFGRGVRD